MYISIIFILFLILIILIRIAYPPPPIIDRQLATKLNNVPYHIWMYWENKKGHEIPTYIKMCQESVKKNSQVKTIILNEKNIKKYLPNLRSDLEYLSIPQKADYIRISLLKEYGGMWLDSDIIVYKSLKLLLKKLETYDYIGFGCHHNYCRQTLNGKNPKPKPANWAMISRKNGILISRCLEKANKIIDSKINLSHFYNYHKLGRELLWSQIDYLLINTKWNYYHHTSKNIERDIEGIKYSNERILTNELMYDNDSYFTPIYNTAPGFPTWFLKMTKSEILNNDMLISQMFRKALKKKYSHN